MAAPKRGGWLIGKIKEITNKFGKSEFQRKKTKHPSGDSVLIVNLIPHDCNSKVTFKQILRMFYPKRV